MMAIIEDVTIELFNADGVKVEIEPDGYVGKLEAGRATIVLKVASGRDSISVFITDGTGKVNVKKNEMPESRMAEHGRLYRRNVAISPSGDGKFTYSQFPDNNIRVLNIGSGGHFDVWEISLISQAGEFFLVAIKTTASRVILVGTDVAAPALDHCPHVRKFVCEQFVNKRDELSHETVAPLGVLVEELPPHIGRVLWWSTPQGFGAILTEQGEARVHWTSIKRPTGRRAYLAPGEKVKFETYKKPHDSGRKTRFELEAVGVSPLIG